MLRINMNKAEVLWKDTQAIQSCSKKFVLDGTELKVQFNAFTAVAHCPGLFPWTVSEWSDTLVAAQMGGKADIYEF